MSSGSTGVVAAYSIWKRVHINRHMWVMVERKYKIWGSYDEFVENHHCWMLVGLINLTKKG